MVSGVRSRDVFYVWSRVIEGIDVFFSFIVEKLLEIAFFVEDWGIVCLYGSFIFFGTWYLGLWR